MSNFVNDQTFVAKQISLSANSPVNLIGTTDSDATTRLLATNCYSLTLINEGTETIYFDFFPYGTAPSSISTTTSFELLSGITITFNLGVNSERVGYQNPFFMTTGGDGTLRSIQMIVNRS